MASSSFLESRFSDSDEGRYAHSCLSSLPWWETMESIVSYVQPMYAFLRFADQDKVPNLSEVLLRFHRMRCEYESLFHSSPRELDRYMNIINPRMSDITHDTYVNAGDVPFPHSYSYVTLL